MSENMEDRKRESEKVTLAGLTARLSVRTGDTKRQTEDFLRELFALIASELEKGESVKVPGLGVFKSIEVEARKSVNVNTGEETLIPGHRKIVYMASKELSATVNEPFSMFQTIELSDEAVTELEGSEATEPELPIEADLPMEPEMPIESRQSQESEQPSESALPDSSDTVVACDVPFSSTVYELEEPEIIPESELERESQQEAESELIPEQPDPDPEPEESNPAVPSELTVPEESSELTEEPVEHRKRFWPGFLVGFAAACLIAFVAVWALFQYGVLSTEQVIDSESKSKSEAIAATAAPASAQTQASEISDSSNKADLTVKEPEVKEPTAGATAEPAVPTQPSDKKVYDTITKTRYLTTMAKDHYGNYHLWPYIYKENEKILGHPDRIRPGTKVVVPPLSKYGVNPNNKADIDKAKKLGNEIYARYN